MAVEDERVAEYHGHFQRGKRHGYGTNFFKDGKKILNLYSNDLPFGTGLEGSYLIDDEKAATQIELSSIL